MTLGDVLRRSFKNLRNWGSPPLQEKGNPRRENDSFISRVPVHLSKVGQDAMGMFIWKELPINF